MTSTVRRTLASALAWTVGASAAVAVGLIALSLIGPGLGVRPVDQLSPDNVGQRLPPVAASASSAPVSPRPSQTTPGPRLHAPPSATPSPAVPSATPAPATSAPISSPPQQINSPGGTVIAQCTGAGVYLLSWSPAQGYRMGEVRRGPGIWTNAVFVSRQNSITIWANCQGGTLQARIDTGGGHDD